MLIFSHRHHKTDSYLLNPPVAFAVVRDPMYLYSKTSQDSFFKHPEFSFLFAQFARSERSRSFCLEKFKENSD